MAILNYTSNIPSTLPSQVSIAREIDLSYDILHPKLIISHEEDGENIRVPFSSFINKYRLFLSDIIMTTDLSPEDYRKYVFKPKTLSYDLYASTELWDILLILNQCTSIIEFDLHTVKYYDPDLLRNYLNEILILEDVFHP